jgi:hypothetical protein
MAKKTVPKLALLVLLGFIAFPAAALTISVAPSEGEEYAPPPDGSGSPLRSLVSGCMDLLFDSGWIVTDSAATRGPRSAWIRGGDALSEAREGLVDYMIAIYVDWVPSSFHKGILLPATVAYSIVRVSDGKTIIEGEVKGSPDSEETSTHFAEAASQVGTLVAQACVKPLRTLAEGGEL